MTLDAHIAPDSLRLTMTHPRWLSVRFLWRHCQCIGGRRVCQRALSSARVDASLDYSIVTYVPGDQQTRAIFAENGWQRIEEGKAERYEAERRD